MASTFLLTVTTIGREIYSHPVSGVTMPGEEGIFEVFQGHEATIAHLRDGDITIQSEDKPAAYHIDKGVALITGENEKFQVCVVAENPSLASKEGIPSQREIER